MKTKLLSLLAFVALSTQVAFSQTSTRGFSFQGYAIDISGQALGNENVTVKFTLSSISNAATPFTEEHAVTTDAFGIFTAIIGNASAASNIAFSKLDFTKAGDDDYTLKVEVKKTAGGTYTTISNEPMAAVPYARKAENGVPVGTTVAFCGAVANIPAEWLLCDGASLASTDYPQLFAAIGTAWGDGTGNSGTGDFNLPDMRGVFLRGAQYNGGNDGDAATRIASQSGGNTGANVGTYQYEDFKSHNHNLRTEFGTSTVNTGAPSGQYNQVNNSDQYLNNQSVKSAGGNETRPENRAVHYIIKY